MCADGRAGLTAGQDAGGRRTHEGEPHGADHQHEGHGMAEDLRISVFVDGLRAHWANGDFHGDTVIVDEARLSVQIGAQFRLGFADVTADDQTALGIAAALAAFRPGRTRFLDLPAEVSDYLYAGHSNPYQLQDHGV